MKNYLFYQSSEYDCGPTSLLNGIRFLFEREEIGADLVKFMMLYSLDTCDEHGAIGKYGTSAAAMSFLSCWLNQYAKVRNFPLRCEFISGEQVSLHPDSKIYQALKNGSAIVVHLFLDVPHYVLLTGIDGDRILLFDPYFEDENNPTLEQEYFYTSEIAFVYDQPRKANRSISIERLNRCSREYYEMGEYETREALIFTRTDRK